MVALTRTEFATGSSTKRIFESALLVTADPDDLAFTIDTVRNERASIVPLSVELDGVAGSAIVWAKDAKRVEVDKESYWFLLVRLTDVISPDHWAAGINSDCVLVVPIDTETERVVTTCYLAELTD